MGILYLVQPAILLNTDRYKIGRSSKGDLSRVRSYGNKTRYLCIMEIDNDIYVERLLINHFNKKYKLIAGHEYFEGDENSMLNTFIDVVMAYKNKTKDNKKTEKYVEETPEIEEITDDIKSEKLKNNWMTKFKYK